MKQNYKLLTGPAPVSTNGIHFFQFLAALRRVHLYDDYSLMDPILESVFPLHPINEQVSDTGFPLVIREDGFACNP